MHNNRRHFPGLAGELVIKERIQVRSAKVRSSQAKSSQSPHREGARYLLLLLLLLSIRAACPQCPGARASVAQFAQHTLHTSIHSTTGKPLAVLHGLVYSVSPLSLQLHA